MAEPDYGGTDVESDREERRHATQQVYGALAATLRMDQKQAGVIADLAESVRLLWRENERLLGRVAALEDEVAQNSDLRRLVMSMPGAYGVLLGPRCDLELAGRPVVVGPLVTANYDTTVTDPS